MSAPAGRTDSNLRRSGLGLAETLVSVAILILLTVLVWAALSSFRDAAALDQALDQSINALEKARSRTLASEGNISYGVHFATSQIIVFRGGAWNANDPANEVIPLSGGVSASAINLATTTASVTFERFSGAAPAAGTVTFTSSRSGRSRRIEILPSGAFRKL